MDGNDYDALYKVTLVDEQDVEYVGIHVSKDEAALAALSRATQGMGQHHWEDSTIGAMPMLQTFTGYDDVGQYWEDVMQGCIKFEVKHFGPYNRAASSYDGLCPRCQNIECTDECMAEG